MMKKLKRIALSALLISLFVMVPTFALASSPGSAGDPLASESWVNEYLDSKLKPMESKLENMRTELLDYMGVGPIDIQLYIDSSTAYVDGVARQIDPDRSSITPRLISDANGGGYTMVPIRFIAESMGTEVAWDNNTKQVTFTEGERVIKLTIGSTTAIINNTTYTMGYAPFISNDRTFVHIRFVAEAFCCLVDWDQDAKRVDIKR